MPKSPTRRRSSTGSKAVKARGGSRAKYASRDVDAVVSAQIERHLQSLGQKKRVKVEKWTRKMKVAVLNKVSIAASHAFDSSETLEQKQQRVHELHQEVKQLTGDLYAQVSERLQQAIKLQGSSATASAAGSAPKISFDAEVRELKSGFEGIAKELQQMNSNIDQQISALDTLTRSVEQKLSQSEQDPSDRATAAPTSSLEALHAHLQRP